MDTQQEQQGEKIQGESGEIHAQASYVVFVPCDDTLSVFLTSAGRKKYSNVQSLSKKTHQRINANVFTGDWSHRYPLPTNYKHSKFPEETQMFSPQVSKTALSLRESFMSVQGIVYQPNPRCQPRTNPQAQHVSSFLYKKYYCIYLIFHMRKYICRIPRCRNAASKGMNISIINRHCQNVHQQGMRAFC